MIKHQVHSHSIEDRIPKLSLADPRTNQQSVPPQGQMTKIISSQIEWQMAKIISHICHSLFICYWFNLHLIWLCSNIIKLLVITCQLLIFNWLLYKLITSKTVSHNHEQNFSDYVSKISTNIFSKYKSTYSFCFFFNSCLR